MTDEEGIEAILQHWYVPSTNRSPYRQWVDSLTPDRRAQIREDVLRRIPASRGTREIWAPRIEKSLR